MTSEASLKKQYNLSMVHSFLGCSLWEPRHHVVRKQGTRHKESPGRGVWPTAPTKVLGNSEHQLADLRINEPTGGSSHSLQAALGVAE